MDGLSAVIEQSRRRDDGFENGINTSVRERASLKVEGCDGCRGDYKIVQGVSRSVGYPIVPDNESVGTETGRNKEVIHTESQDLVSRNAEIDLEQP